MVSGVTPLEKSSPVDAVSECWQDRQPFLSNHQKVLPNGRCKNANLQEPLSEFADQNGKMQTELRTDSTACNVSRFPAGVKGTQDETSLFSSSLSDLLMHKLRFSASNASFHESASNVGSQNSHLGSVNCVEEIDAQAIKNLLPDEEELLSGVTSLGHVTHGGNQDDFEDFDLFSSIGGIELEADERIWAGNRSANFNKSMPNSQWGSARVALNPNDEFLLQNTTRLLNGGIVQKGSPHNSSGIDNTFHPSAFQASAGNQFNLCQASHSPNFVNFDSCYVNSLHSHSLPDAHSHLAKVVPWNSLDNMTDCTAESPRVTGEISRDLYQAGLAAKAASVNGRAYGYSANGTLPYQMDRYLSGKSDLYECHPSRSSVWSNSPSFLNGEHASYAVQLPGFHKLPHAMMNVASPIHLQVGSAPGVNGAFWDPLESFDELSVKPNSMQSVGMHFGSPANSVEMSTHHNFSHAGGTCMGTPNHAEIISQMSHSLNGRNPSVSMPSSFGFPNERVRNRANSSNADKKNYELNIDRIMRGDDARTTLMIKNIPNKYTSKMLLATIDEQHKGQYDFIYLPIDFKNKCNVGYAFINMVDPKHIVSFYRTFNGKRWEKFNSEKIASLAYARIQGKSALIAHFQNSSLMNEDKRCRPILFQTEGPNAGDQEPFPSSNSFRLRSGRAHAIFNGDMEGRGQGRCNGTKA